MTRFGEPDALALLWLAPLAAAVLLGGVWLRRRALRRFVDADLADEIAPGVSVGRAIARAALLTAALALGVVGLARPQGDPQPGQVQRVGRDVCIIVDVSKSMLADDLAPTRLGRTKIWLNDLIDTLAGDRVAIIAMAGNPVLASPLTHDYAFVRSTIESLDPNTTSLGGTNLGDAVRLAIDKAFPEEASAGDGEQERRARFRDVIVISDGEDTASSMPVEAARAAGERGMRLVTLGIGSPDGAPVPQTDRFGNSVGVQRDREGQPIISRLDAGTLRDMAAATPGGVFVNVGTRDIALGEEYRRLMAESELRELERAAGLVYDEWFQAFALAALACLFIGETINERRRV